MRDTSIKGDRGEFHAVADDVDRGQLLGGLGRNGTLLLLGAGAEAVSLSGLPMIMKRLRVMGWPSGVPQDSQDTMAFSAMASVRSRNEVFPLARAAEAYEHMLQNKARFRAVLKVR